MINQLDTEDKNVDRPDARDANYSGLGPAVTSLVLGIISIPFSLFLIGGVCGLVGLVLAIVHLRKRYFLRSMAWWGLSLSIAGLLATAGFAIYVFSEIRQIKETMTMIESQSYDEWIGTEAPNFALKDLENNSITLSALRGRRVVLDFWATWCPPCRREIPHFGYYLMILVKLYYVYKHQRLIPARCYAARPSPDAEGR